jgi:DNA-binding PadR family transcriptional regulator
MKDDASRFLPLAPATLHILLALAGEDLHGYGIMQEVARQSEGRYNLGPGTLYDNLQRMLNQGLVQEISRRGANRLSNEDPRRRYYRLSSLGRSVLSGEIARLESVVRDARLRLQTAKPRGA